MAALRRRRPSCQTPQGLPAWLAMGALWTPRLQGALARRVEQSCRSRQDQAGEAMPALWKPTSLGRPRQSWGRDRLWQLTTARRRRRRTCLMATSCQAAQWMKCCTQHRAGQVSEQACRRSELILQRAFRWTHPTSRRRRSSSSTRSCCARPAASPRTSGSRSRNLSLQARQRRRTTRSRSPTKSPTRSQGNLRSTSLSGKCPCST
mmetsp:Transcript_50011/g.88091  ORF Transcript_50011/g.88091 Transcript_50011/m.88091 type:complete len:206 (+) Transcript_50011:354-971(+)